VPDPAASSAEFDTRGEVEVRHALFELMNTSHEARDVSEIQHTGWGCRYHWDGVEGVH